MNDMANNDDDGSDFKECRFAKIIIYKLDTFENKCSYWKVFFFSFLFFLTKMVFFDFLILVLDDSSAFLSIFNLLELQLLHNFKYICVIIAEHRLIFVSVSSSMYRGVGLSCLYTNQNTEFDIICLV